MSKKYYHIIIVLLIVLNIFSWRLWWEKPSVPPKRDKDRIENDKRRSDGANRLYEELDLSEDQKEQFETLRKEYFDKVFKINKELDDIRRHLSNKDSKITDSLFEEMGSRKTLLEKETFMHFKNLREVCDEEQKAKFDTVHKRMMNRFNRWSHRKRDR